MYLVAKETGHFQKGVQMLSVLKFHENLQQSSSVENWEQWQNIILMLQHKQVNKNTKTWATLLELGANLLQQTN